MKFTPEHRALSDTVTKFVAKEINPFVAEWEAAEIYPAHAVMKKLGNLGLLGLKYPEEFGGAGLDFSYSMVMAEALGAAACGGVPMSIGGTRPAWKAARPFTSCWAWSSTRCTWLSFCT